MLRKTQKPGKIMWTKKRNRLVREFKFKDFREALKFTNSVGKVAEKLQHHPDIIMHDWNQVRIETTTHDAGYKITERDHKLAKAIDKLI